MTLGVLLPLLVDFAGTSSGAKGTGIEQPPPAWLGGLQVRVRVCWEGRDGQGTSLGALVATENVQIPIKPLPAAGAEAGGGCGSVRAGGRCLC